MDMMISIVLAFLTMAVGGLAIAVNVLRRRLDYLSNKLYQVTRVQEIIDDHVSEQLSSCIQKGDRVEYIPVDENKLNVPKEIIVLGIGRTITAIK